MNTQTKYMSAGSVIRVVPLFCAIVMGCSGSPDEGGVEGSSVADAERHLDLGLDGASLVLLEGTPSAVKWFGGRIYIAGTRDNDFWVTARLDSGAVDPTFGDAGNVSFHFEQAEVPFAYRGAHALEVTGDHILVAGSATEEWAILRLNLAGQIDETFGDGGGVLVNWTSVARAYQVREDDSGRIYVGGSIDNSSNDAAMVRLDSLGNLDPTFSGTGEGAGVVLVKKAYDEEGLFMELTDTGVFLGGSDTEFARRDLDGKLDNSFAQDGWLEVNDGYLTGATLLDDGSLIVAGPELKDAEEEDSDEDLDDGALLLAKVRPDGTFDPGFGSSGIARISYNMRDYAFVGKERGYAGGGLYSLRGLSSLPGGGVLIYADTLSLASHPVLLKVLPNGELDRSFGQNGAVALDLKIPNLLSSLDVPANRLVVHEDTAWLVDSIWPTEDNYWLEDERPSVLVRIDLGKQ
jgi:uncharacterized delta-60 repeat protein